MNAVDQSTEKQHLSRLRRMRDTLEGSRWLIEDGGRETHIVVVRQHGECEHIATIHAAALPEELELISGALMDDRFLLALVERAAARFFAMEQAQVAGPDLEKVEETGNVAFSAKALCGVRIFHRFLEQKCGGAKVDTAEAAEAALKKILGITQKRELNKPGPARERFRALKWEYYQWKKGDV